MIDKVTELYPNEALAEFLTFCCNQVVRNREDLATAGLLDHEWINPDSTRYPDGSQSSDWCWLYLHKSIFVLECCSLSNESSVYYSIPFHSPRPSQIGRKNPIICVRAAKSTKRKKLNATPAPSEKKLGWRMRPGRDVRRKPISIIYYVKKSKIRTKNDCTALRKKRKLLPLGGAALQDFSMTDDDDNEEVMTWMKKEKKGRNRQKVT